ncbi:MAG: homocysteine S-methyltransferase family protein [Lachnospiraceae bacterium]|nr:homocysteine S-methyltransferase family protein [Candidatus Equihabitans merdae]
MGTLLQAMGMQPGELPERWNINHPEEVKSIGRRYLEAGVNVINTNTFEANLLHYPDAGERQAVIEAAVKLANEVRDESGRDDVYIALDIGPSGKMMEPMGDLSFDDAVEIFADMIRIGAKAGVDLILFETFTDSYEAKAAVLAAKENSNLPVALTMIFDETGKLLTGGTPDSVVPMLEGLGIDALGVNCGLGPKQLYPVIKRMTEIASVPVIASPNAGLPEVVDGKTVFRLSPEIFSDEMVEVAALGVQCLGGCCGTTPDHIRQMIGKVKDIPFKEPVYRSNTVVTSFAKAVDLRRHPVVIGERINPTGKKKFQEALRQNDVAYILDRAVEQEEAGAHILDVNCGLPGIDEPAMMETLVKAIQGITALPLQLDTSDPVALEKGLRYYNGKPMVNSVNGKEAVMADVFPLLKKYGGVLVVLPLDEDGIPATSDDRLAVAKRVFEEADKYGVARKDLVVDGLTMTISSDQRAGEITLDTIRKVREELDCGTILGVSNVSFGLPRREIINAHFMTMAMEQGLTCAIINPNNEGMMASYRAYMALHAIDDHCGDYIAAYAGTKAGASVPANAPKASSSADKASANVDGNAADQSQNSIRIREYIERGLAEKAADAAKEALAGGMKTLDIVNNYMVPALDQVGKLYGDGTIFLPQLMMSAEAAQGAFAVLKEAVSDQAQEVKGRIALATVKGDIHEIGKNIVKVMLESYGFEVLDLGKDVAPETILEVVRKEELKLVGLSALMTTTVFSMEDTITLLKKEAPEVKIVVGGAVLTENYAAKIGADYYAKDAMDTVSVANTVLCS